MSTGYLRCSCFAALLTVLASGHVVFAATAPGAPTSVTTVPSNGKVTLSWTPPSNNGGSAITTYKIQYSTNNGGAWYDYSLAASTSTTVAVGGLTNGVSYWFRVAAANAIGTGVFSAMTVPAIPTSATSSNELWHNASSEYSIAIWNSVDAYGVGRGSPVVLSPGQNAYPVTFAGGNRTLYIAYAKSASLRSGWYTVVNPNQKVTITDAKQITIYVAGFNNIRVNNRATVSMY